MDDGHRNFKSIMDSLKDEWSLFWESFIETSNDGDQSALIDNQSKFQEKIGMMSSEEVEILSRSMSQNRKAIHQKLETLQKEIDLNLAKLESLRLVGSEDTSTLERLNELNDLGHHLNQQLVVIDEQMKKIRQKEAEV